MFFVFQLIKYLKQFYHQHLFTHMKQYLNSFNFLKAVGQIKANPLVLFLGPWSTGKTTMLKYILDTDMLRTGKKKLVYS